MYEPFDPSTPLEFEKKKKGFSIGKLISLVLILVLIITISVGGYYGFKVWSAVNSTQVCIEQNPNDCKTPNFFEEFVNGVTNQNSVKIKGEDEGRTNFLLIGLDAAADLTDTMIIMSLFHKEKKIVTVNLPRDVYVNTSYTGDDGSKVFITEKANAIYPFAQNNSQNKGAGVKALNEFIENEYGIKIHYFISTNFEGVEKLIDALGGVNVNVDIAFTDCQYPNKTYGYIRPCPSFKTGQQFMDGETALIYARSRHAAEDGGDFARSRRQSIVMQAITKKIKEKGVAGNANSLSNYLNILTGYVEFSSMTPSEMLSLYDKFSDLDTENGFLRIVWDDAGGIFCPGSVTTGYHLIYCGGAIPGRNSNSEGREKARFQIKNMLLSAEGNKLFQSSVAILGNQSNETVKAQNSFLSAGFENVIVNNSYRGIAEATSTSVEKVNIYIADNKLKENYKKLANELGLNFTLVDNLNKTLPNSAKSAQIIVWVE
jgi:LCP family protein required for cell wall assembly